MSKFPPKRFIKDTSQSRDKAHRPKPGKVGRKTATPKTVSLNPQLTLPFPAGKTRHVVRLAQSGVIILRLLEALPELLLLRVGEDGGVVAVSTQRSGQRVALVLLRFLVQCAFLVAFLRRGLLGGEASSTEAG